MDYKKFIIGFLTILVALSVVYVNLNNIARFRVDKDDTTFYIKQLDESGEPYGRWLISAIETNKMFDGSSLINRQLKDGTVSNFIYKDNTSSTIRIMPYANGGYIQDTYITDGKIKNPESFPISHTVEFFNMNSCGARGCIYQYEVGSLVYDQGTRIATSPEEFGMRMKVSWDESAYYSKIFDVQGKDKLIVKFRVTEDYQKINVRLFDPILIQNKIEELCYNVDYTRINRTPIYSMFQRNVSCNSGNESCLNYSNSSTYKIENYQMITNFNENEYIETVCEFNGAVSYNDEIISFDDFWCRYCEDEEIILCHHKIDGLGKYNNCKIKPGQTTWIKNVSTGNVLITNSFNSKLKEKEIDNVIVKEVFLK